ncbi:MAG: hypothetical protein COZ86_00120 [Candidatus Moranbacteria bacterium CG_4_8_14_3_um_filter_41_13]|nr:MAG: hypothetical protein COZ86_00120 [Candidatus Moranbacteria bacterium CG_4_8_14_3_um_filter_41_13]PJC00530.1 MAG: hypothetical protein CO075_00130 [Candidatus Moranbacteria bacterium CG_4_9_14_0_8_um_filter_41_43]HCJ45889.1 hypothetical protein [Candidatus Moranbacteria bacterium]
MKNEIFTSIQVKTLLLDAGVITEDQSIQAEERSKSTGETFEQSVLWYSFISDEELGRLLADALGVPFVVVSAKSILPEVLHIIPEVVARTHSVIAFDLDKEGLHIAMTDVNISKCEISLRKNQVCHSLFLSLQKEI